MSNITDSVTNKLHKILITLFLVYVAIFQATTLNLLNIRIILSHFFVGLELIWILYCMI